MPYLAGRAAAAVTGVLLIVMGVGAAAQAAEPTPTVPTPTSTCVAPPVSGIFIGQTSSSLTFSVTVPVSCGGFHPASVAVYTSFGDAQSGQNQRGSAVALTVAEAARLTVNGLTPGTAYWYRFAGGGSTFMSLVQGPVFTAVAPRCSATYQLDGEWPGGLVARVNVRNSTGAPISGWRVGWSWPGQQAVTLAWSAAIAASGATVSATNATYNGALAPDGVTTFGFLATTNDPPPTDLSLTCTVTV